MNREIINEFKSKKVLIWGMGREGVSTYNFIKKHLPDSVLYLSDSNLVNNDNYKNDIVILEKDLNLLDYDIVMKAPGVVSYDLKGNIQTQSTLFLKYFKEKVIGITGTKGKSTTSSLLYHILKDNYPSVFFVGNIGIACFDIIDEIAEDSIVVFEISCHQLEYSKDSPHVGVLLNLYEEHLDHYESYEKYKLAKKQIFLNQKENDIAIINADLKNEITDKDNIIWANKDIYAIDNILYNNCSHVEINETSLIGEHNFYNLSIVYYITHVLFNISDDEFKSKVKSFIPLEHRLEYVGCFNGIRYVNDSISTIGQATISAIKSLKDVDTVLIGGMDRHIDYSDLIKFLNTNQVNNVILMYETGKRILPSLTCNKYYVLDLYEAVALAKRICAKDKICLLSPAAASYGYFKNFEERGREFKRLAHEL